MSCLILLTRCAWEVVVEDQRMGADREACREAKAFCWARAGGAKHAQAQCCSLCPLSCFRWALWLEGGFKMPWPRRGYLSLSSHTCQWQGAYWHCRSLQKTCNRSMMSLFFPPTQVYWKKRRAGEGAGSLTIPPCSWVQWNRTKRGKGMKTKRFKTCLESIRVCMVGGDTLVSEGNASAWAVVYAV